MISHFKSAMAERSKVPPKIRQLEHGVKRLTENSLAHSPQPLHHPGHLLHLEMSALRLINHSPFSWRCLEVGSRKKV